MKVLKFGGTSVGSVERIKTVLNIITQEVQKGEEMAVVFSAMGGATNQLIEMSLQASQGNDQYKEMLKKLHERHYEVINALVSVKVQSKIFANLKILFNELDDILHGVFLIKEISQRTQDLIMSFGERLSSYIIFECLKGKGVEVEFVDSREVIKTDDNFGNARVNFEITNKNLKAYFNDHKKLQIVTGFIASTEKNETTTLGRGGSDYTASIIAAAVNATDIEIWTDVDGIMTADPRSVKKAFTLPVVTYVEAMEMSHFGAKVIYPPSLQPAFNKKIPLKIKNTFNPEFEGTLVTEKGKKNGFLIKGISSINNVALLNLQGGGMVGVTGISARLFNALANNNINIILITQASSEHSICFAVDPKDAVKAGLVIEKEFAFEISTKKIEKAIIETDLSIIAIIGENMKHTPGISGKLFNALGKNGINVVAIAQGSSEYNVSVVIGKNDLSKALNALHDSFFLSNTKTLNVYIIGVGLIGSTLINQLEKQAEFLASQRSLNINIVGLGNTRKMLFKEDGIDKKNWKSLMESEGVFYSMKDYTDKMFELNLPNSVFVDNTASKEIVNHYKAILESSISIVTPNKHANSGSFSQYNILKNTAKNHGVSLLYETNVGAGLPVLSTLQDLIISGDQILKIEAILSGTLSFIFNNFKDGAKFSEVVKIAKEKGYTEPDPRDDLNGMDVARKILILARDSGFNMEPEDVKVENILPLNCQKAKSVPEFFEELEKENEYFEKKRKDAEAKGQVLRFIATLENGKAFVSLKAVDGNHPFYSLSGSDNVISFTTERYKDRPLVVKGPGAGAEVTAAGVFADIISVSTYLS
ncbi:MAG TPA: bifunctional aspartate kinase/homoserine dehydrogenase I [Cytophagales bacterium]|nr:bifunctional aspartate kinase/homoserine dehydrogenase I [Cytophagales bacterium]